MGNNIQDIDVCIVGSGISGLFISSKLLLNNHSVLLLENSDKVGGQINLYKEKIVYNIPLSNPTKSIQIVEKLYNEIIDNKNLFFCINSHIIDISKKDDYFLVDVKDSKTLIEKQFLCKYIILAFGKGNLEPNKLPLIGAETFENKTLLYNIENKELFYNKDIVIAGGGDSVIDWSCELYNKAKSITILHRRNIEKPENPQIMLFNKICHENKINFKIPYKINKLYGKNGILSSIDIENIESNNIENINCDYLFPFYGLKTIQNGLDIYNKLGIKFIKQLIGVNIVNNETNISNIFAVGDCCYYDGKIDNIIMGISDCLKCFYEICRREKTIGYGHK